MQKAENSFWDNFTPFIYRIGIIYSEKMAFFAEWSHILGGKFC